MSVIAKFYVSKLTRHEGAPTADKIELGAVCRGAENKLWASATPSGSIVMFCLNDAATDQFEEGAEYEVTFRRVEKPKPGDGHAPELYSGGRECGRCGMYPGRDEGTGEYDDWSKHAEVYGA